MLKFLRKLTAIPAVKYSIIAVTSFLWLVGFADQLPDVEQAAKYVGISLLMLAVQYFRSRLDLLCRAFVYHAAVIGLMPAIVTVHD